MSRVVGVDQLGAGEGGGQLRDVRPRPQFQLN
jgi:hypothetical protein